MVKKKGSLSDTGNSLVQSGIAFGKIKNAAGAAFMMFIGTILILIGLYYIFFKEDTPTVSMEGECLEESEVRVHFNKEGERITTAYTDVKWVVDGVEYTKVIKTSKKYLKGDLMKIEYVVGVPDDAWNCCRTKNAVWGYWMTGGGSIFVLLGAVLWYFRNNEFLAAGSALGTFSG